jgi:hypothetical protein
MRSHTDPSARVIYAWPGPLGSSPTPFTLSAPPRWTRRWAPGTVAVFDAGVDLEAPPSGIGANLVVQRAEISAERALAEIAADRLHTDRGQCERLILLDEAVTEVSGRPAVLRRQRLELGGADRAVDQLRLLILDEAANGPSREVHDIIATCDSAQIDDLGPALDAAVQSFRLHPVEGTR